MSKTEPLYTNLRIKKTTLTKFRMVGLYGESADEIINRLVDHELKARGYKGKIAQMVENARTGGPRQ